MTFDECYPNHRDPYAYIVKNPLAACQLTDLRYQRYACPEASCPVVASASARVIVIRNAQPDQRRVVVGHQVVNWRVDNLPETTRFGIGMTCLPQYPTGTAACDVPEIKVAKSIAEWKAEPTDLQVFTMRGEDLPSATDIPQVQAEKRTWYSQGRYLYFEDSPSDNARLEAPPVVIGVRCDVARLRDSRYARGSDCVFPTTHSFVVDTRDPKIHDSALLVDAAMNNFSTTYPGPLEGRFVPGNKGPNSAARNYPLTRRYYDQAATDANQARAEQSCVARWGAGYRTRPDGQTNDCAVYPFNGTIDGANQSPPGTPDGASYAVKPVLTADNKEFTDRVDRFVAENHILQGDQYWVWVLK
ncbi:transporter [Amycolatopsis samaneae]|uniref:Transporter n=1 Tax=Amycolatopsis samaneae TaxID=664691 RepID=A0ABW5GHR9_9PSEU